MLVPFQSTRGSDLGAVIQPPPATPVASFEAVKNDLLATFSDTSVAVEGVASWLWEFGDGGFSVLQNPAHLFSANGTYQVSLTVTTSTGRTAKATQEVTVPAISSLSAAVSALAGKTLVLPPGTYPLDAMITDGTTRIVLQHGTIITVPSSRTLGSELDFSQGGKIQPASGVVVTLTGKINCPQLHHAFDLSAGGSFSITRRIPFMTPDMFGAVGDDTADDNLAVAAAFGVLFAQNGGHVFCPNRYAYVQTAPFPVCEGTYLAGLGRNSSGLRNKSTTGVNMFNPVGGAFERGWVVYNINLICEEQAGHIVEPDADAGISDSGWLHVDAKVLNPLKSIWHQEVTQRGTFFFSFRDCRLECGTQSVRSQVPAIDIDGVDNSFSSVWFTNCRLQCNHSKAVFFRATNSAGGNPLKQLVFRDCASEQMQSGIWQVQGTIGFTLDTFTLFDTVTPVRGHPLELQTGTGGLGNEGAAIRNWLRTGAELGQAAGPLLEVASITRSGTTATVTLVPDHGWVTGDRAEVNGCTPAGYEGDQPITVTGAKTFTYPCGGSLATPATPRAGGITARRVGRSVSSMTQAAGVATCNLQQGHGAELGQRFFVEGADQAGYNGLRTITEVTDTDTVKFAVDPGTVSPATGTITAGLAALDIQMGPDDVRAYLDNVVGGSQDANVDVNDTSAIIVGKSTALELLRVPANTSTVLGIGSGASVETSAMVTDGLAARSGGPITLTSILEAMLGVSFAGNADITDLRVATPSLDFPSLALGASAELTVTISGIGTTWRSSAAPQTTIEAGLEWNWWISAADTLRIRVTNVNGANPLDPASRSWLCTCWKH